MSKPRVVIFAAVAVTALCLVVGVGTAKHTPALSVRVIEVINNWNQLEVVVQVTNNTAYAYYPAIVGLEIWNGKSWEISRTEQPRGVDLVQATGAIASLLREHADGRVGCFIHRKPGERLRLVIKGWRIKRGLRSFLFRLRRRLLSGDRVSLNPLDSTPMVYPDATAVTDEFRAP